MAPGSSFNSGGPAWLRKGRLFCQLVQRQLVPNNPQNHLQAVPWFPATPCYSQIRSLNEGAHVASPPPILAHLAKLAAVYTHFEGRCGFQLNL